MVNDYKVIRYHSKNNQKVENLMHYINKEALKEQHDKQKQDKARGIDGINKMSYGLDFGNNIEKLISKMKTMSYIPQSVRRTYIPKQNGKLRPLGIPAYEDRLVQGIMAEILNEIYEPKFLECSYGFRPNRNCHQAIRQINQTSMIKKVNYILDCDIKGFFDNVDHKWLVKFLEHDIQDVKFIRYIVRFLKSGYMENMKYYETDKGTPQGGLISPILANVYLHYVLDRYFEEIVKPHLKGEAYLIRYADDFIIMFQFEEDAKRTFECLIKRLAKYGLEMEQSKTRILPFGRFKGTNETFDFLGFMHYNGITKTGKYTVGHKISKKKKKDKRKKIKEFIKENRHNDILDTINKMNKILIGIYAYYGINGMVDELKEIKHYVFNTILNVYKSRSQRNKFRCEQLVNILNFTPLSSRKVYHNIWI